jgi:hypothetical protein
MKAKKPRLPPFHPCGLFGYRLYESGANEMPVSPTVVIELGFFGRNEAGVPRITPHCISEAELEANIQELHAALDYAGRRAKTAIRRANARAKKKAARLAWGREFLTWEREFG